MNRCVSEFGRPIVHFQQQVESKLRLDIIVKHMRAVRTQLKIIIYQGLFSVWMKDFKKPTRKSLPIKKIDYVMKMTGYKVAVLFLDVKP